MKLQRYKHDSATSYALGATLVAELLKTHPEYIQRIFLRPVVKHGEDLEKILTTLQTKHIEIIESTKAFNILNAKDSCLLIAEFTKPQTSLDDTTPHIVLVNPSDSGNLGTIIRTAVAFNYRNLAIITPAVDPYDPKVIRASMGAIFHLNIVLYESIEQYLTTDRTLYAFMLNQNADELEQCQKPTDNFSLIFGNEASGLPSDFCTKTNAKSIFIPQSNDVDSLNLSVAAAIAMHYFQK